MASPPRPSGPIHTGGPEPTGEVQDSHSSDGFSAPLPCPWRTRLYHDDECSRYFDCPTHTLERDLSTTESQSHAPLSGPRTRDIAHLPATGDISLGGMLETPIAGPSGISSGIRSSETRPIPVRTSSLTGGTTTDTSLRSPVPSTQLSSGREESGPFSSPITDQRRQLTARRSQGGPGMQRARSSEDGGASQHRTQGGGSSPEVALPRWQPDAEVTYCPICNTQFSIFVRKHHCRKCGRVVCNSCSPHRIIIPHQYIVRAPGSEVSSMSTTTSLLLDGLGAGYFDAGGSSGGERVRLCNPCVPDPNTAPPQSPASSTGASSPSHRRSRSNVYGVAHGGGGGGGYGAAAVFTTGRSGDAYQYYAPRWRSVTMGPTPHGGSGGPSGRIGATHHAPLDRFLAAGPSGASSRRHRHNSFGDATSSRHRALPPPPPPPPPPQIAEEDECPICHGELPSRGLPNYETLRESHISLCIQAHSTYGSPRGGGGGSDGQPAPRRTGMYTYAATEKDCVDDAECTICLEEFAVGVAMARLECLCRFHKACISAWFVNHPGRCPVHQHDGFGF
ncbi:hypothetical protein L249_8378 [Ophiocordyceps polyrhachis-furcata BCC 54312]|uniref:FYVE-type domain-containing protein n=1 Tax=Ophiocordyceps polyrhachis-furcata BCC 54312 TaxID=1330021 RepID=A0A367L6A9_9HYPO|nr:hypothetical protein L249_8378 [Ophiocordyceps polyrhachis-furcata BCC 54312]